MINVVGDHYYFLCCLGMCRNGMKCNRLKQQHNKNQHQIYREQCQDCFNQDA